MMAAPASVESYLAKLTPDRRAALAEVRAAIISHLPAGYAEGINWGMIAYEVPLAAAPKAKNGKPLLYAGLASQKNHMAIYLPPLRIIPGLLERFASEWSARKMDLGAACLRFRSLTDLDLAAIGRVIAATSPADFVAASKG